MIGGLTSKTSLIEEPRIYYDLFDGDAKPPERAYEEAVGYDLYACILTDTRAPSVMYIPPRHTIRIPTGLCLATDPGYYLQVHSRSGLACGIPPIFVANGPGIIDPDYRGPIHVILYNGGDRVYAVKHHERVGQVLIAIALIGEVEKRPGMKEEVTNRGHRGYGSSGR